MKTFSIAASRSYDVIIGDDIIRESGKYIRQIYSPRKVCLITDSTVNSLYADRVMSSLEESGFSVGKIIFPSGEHAKNHNIYANILESIAGDGLSRSDLIVALGGGVVLDLAGFVAGTYMRGIDYICIPTTLLASIDTAIGGKTGINLINGKNLVGVFWQPSLVLCDYSTFSSLADEYMLDGIAEALKCAFISDAGLIPHIRSKNYEYIIERCVSLKKSLIEVDERDKGIRQLLNFGHTIGHGIEKVTSYEVSHGKAVAKGMIGEARGAYRTGHTKQDVSSEITDILESFGFDTSLNYDSEQIYELALMDKKIFDDEISMIIPESIGRCTLKKLRLEELHSFINLGMAQ